MLLEFIYVLGPSRIKNWSALGGTHSEVGETGMFNNLLTWRSALGTSGLNVVRDMPENSAFD